MTLLSWLPARHAPLPSLPEPRSSLRSTPSRLVPLAVSGPRWHTAVVHLEDTLSAWSLPVQLARTWMRPTRALFEQDIELELFVQHDPVDGTVSVELWDDQGVRRFGVETRASSASR